ncbi:MAG: metallophosphoesterase [Polyangiaceae bacterium]
MLALFPWLSAGAAALVVLTAGIVRGRLYAVFAAVFLTVHTLLSNAMAPLFAAVLPAYMVLQALVYVHFALLAVPRMRPFWYRALVSLPASFFSAATFLAMPWAIAKGVGLHPYGFFVPYAIALLGLLQSLRHRFEVTDIALDGRAAPSLTRHKLGEGRVDRPLRVVQITDPHLGPFMSEERLRGIAERAVAADPDLVLLTGDFLTMESHDAEDVLARALSPLKALEGKVFACRGNHDHEAPETVARALDAIGATLLIDEERTVDTPAGPVQILGIDFHFRDREQRTRAVVERHPRTAGALRLVLLHDPGAFRHVPDGEADLVLSGHTHGGQLGLLVLGLPHTFVSAFTQIPDHGLWALGKNRLYVHRGTGHYGFPLRVGVPGEESLLRIHRVDG